MSSFSSDSILRLHVFKVVCWPIFSDTHARAASLPCNLEKLGHNAEMLQIKDFR